MVGTGRAAQAPVPTFLMRPCSNTYLSMACFLACLMALALQACSRTPGSALGEDPSGDRSLRVSLQADRPVYRTGQPVTFRLTLMNQTDSPVVRRCRDAQRFDVSIADPSGKEVWRWSTDQMFAQILSEETINPGKSRTYTAVFSETLPPGEYRASGVILCLDSPLSADAVFTVR